MPLIEIRSPWNDSVVARVEQATAEQLESVLTAAHQAVPRLRALSAMRRRAVLQKLAELVEQHRATFVDAIINEAGKPRTAANTEVSRAIEVLTLAAAELAHFGGEIVPVDLHDAGQGARAEVRRFAAGVIVGIVPFNFPLNLGMHKVAPALAVGAPIIIKPPPQAPTAQLLVAKLAIEAGADPAALQVVCCDNALAEKLATDARVRVVSFTGSAAVGWHLKQVCPGRVTLELGGNAAAIVCADADLELAATKLAVGAFTYSGQVCIKVQRIIVVGSAFDSFRDKFIDRVRALGVGDPQFESTVVGPVIDDRSALRIEAWLAEATSRGAAVLLGGKRDGRRIEPTVLTNVPHDVKAYREEIFGPVVILERVDTVEAAIARVNDSDYGLQAALFTFDTRTVRKAFDELEVGGVIVNDAPSFRSDNMPYGGVKRSGLGREGVRYAMADYTEERVLVTR